jgi:hypothetical protein
MAAEGSGTVCGQYFYMLAKDKRPANGKYAITLFAFMDGTNFKAMLMGVD